MQKKKKIFSHIGLIKRGWQIEIYLIQIISDMFGLYCRVKINICCLWLYCVVPLRVAVVQDVRVSQSRLQKEQHTLSKMTHMHTYKQECLHICSQAPKQKCVSKHTPTFPSHSFHQNRVRQRTWGHGPPHTASACTVFPLDPTPEVNTDPASSVAENPSVTCCIHWPCWYLQ